MGKQTTGTRDRTYDLLACVYHALRGADAAAKYRDDASTHGDDEAVQFFDSIVEENRDLAERGKKLLRERFGRGDEKSSDEVVDQQIDESFPASDAPANY